ncbi:MAG: type II toxin-antitoxin system RelE/ParE family toxin [Gemmatimonadales bacterium]
MRAVGHLEAIHGYIAQSSALYASSMIERLHARAGQLEAFPDSGRPVPEDRGAGAREIFEHPYRIIYETQGSQVEVLAVLHMRQEG